MNAVIDVWCVQIGDDVLVAETQFSRDRLCGAHARGRVLCVVSIVPTIEESSVRAGGIWVFWHHIAAVFA